MRIWQRPIVDGDIPLRFRVVPGVWPDIEIAPADGTSADVTAPAHEVVVIVDPGRHGTLLLDVAGVRVAGTGRAISAGDHEVVAPGSGPLRLDLVVRDGRGVLTIDDLAPIALDARQHDQVRAVAPVTENVADFRVATRAPDSGRLQVGVGAVLLEAMIYGLREPESALYRTALAAGDGPGALFYASGSFAVHDREVSDASGPAALVPDGRTIVSPIRVTEEFVWRDTPYGDMTRVVDRGELWRSRVEPGRFPRLSTRYRSLDAAFELALETFQRNAGTEFALPGQAGMWSAGYFQGSGEGFGVWKRDAAHIALRSGNLLDPAIARASLAHVVNSGFDNGSDGDALPAVAVWDHHLATGDETLIAETWDALAAAGEALQARFDERRCLVTAAQSTSNDLFDEPEAAGFALSTEVYAMRTFEVLSWMAAMPAVSDGRGERWAALASAMRRSIGEQYWSDRHGFYTSGPAGSEAHERGYWETSGAEAVLWFLGEHARSRTTAVLSRLREVAMSPYGVTLFPYRPATDHFTGTVWYVWQAGLARAAARAGDAGLVHQLVGQQVRTAVLNKAFYEVTDAATGASWRWPGQLWHAAGFVSLVLSGVLGLRYGLDGVTFRPAVAPEFEGLQLERLRYRDALLDIEVRGHGTRCVLTVDGRPADRIEPAITGRHSVVLAMR